MPMNLGQDRVGETARRTASLAGD